MRQVKFRVWDEYEEKFYYTTDSYDGFWFDFDDKENLKAWAVRESHYSAGYEHPPEDKCEELEPVEQFTGLLDKAGKEIWEGDIIKSPGFSNEDVVKYEEILLSDDMTCPGIGFQFNEDPSKMEIIGNIHQHKHLLENK